MAALSEEQLLLLDNLMYYHSSAGAGTCVADICNDILSSDNSDLKDMLSGGFEKEPSNMRDIAEAILNDPALSSMTVTASVDKNNVYATCFVDPQGDATVAIRGTGGSYEAWDDNFKGAYDTDTRCQETMMEFADQLKANGYTDITVTGHSKGGNMAQYVTLLSDDLVGRCVSFDGQGFNEDFLSQYADEIAANSWKIKSICAHNDYVNVMLNSVAAETIFLANDADDFSGMHSSYELWKSNQENQKYGRYFNTVDQDSEMVTLDLLIDKFTNDMNDLPGWLQKKVADRLGSLVGLFFGIQTKQIDLDDALDLIFSAWKLDPVSAKIFADWFAIEVAKLSIYATSDEIKEDLRRKWQSEQGTALRPAAFSVNLQGLDNASIGLEQCASSVDILLNDLDSIHPSIFQVITRIRLRLLKNSLSKEIEDILRMKRVLDAVKKKYDNSETAIVSEAVL